MATHQTKPGFRRGTSLIEVSVGLLVFMIVALGSMHYRYVTAAQIQKARRQLTAADLAVTALETWQGLGGDESFDPPTAFAADLTLTATGGDAAPSGSALLGGYDVAMGGYTYHLTLYWRDVETGLRELGTVAAWPLGDGDENKTFQLTSYARR